MSTYRLSNVLAPRAVALVGASSRQGSLGAAILQNIRSCGFAGQIGLVNPRHGEIAGMKTASHIDKLPFAPPDDPVLAARIEALGAQGGNAFREVQLPQAILALKQGAGRLIRDETDRGVLVLCDPRLHSRSYGKTILASLPPMRTTRELRQVEAFFRATIAPVPAQEKG